MHLDWTVDAKSVAIGLAVGFPRPDALLAQEPSAAQQSAARAAVAAFLGVRPALVMQLPKVAALSSRGWPSPRSWETVGGAVGRLRSLSNPEDARAALVMGSVGEGPALELLSWLANADLPDPEVVLADPDAFVLPERSDRAYAALTAVASVAVARADAGSWTAAWRVVAKAADAAPDVAALVARTLAAARPEGADLPAEVLTLAPVLRAAGPDASRRSGMTGAVGGSGAVTWWALGDLPGELRQRWAAARVWAARQAPYLASALLALEPVVVEGDEADLRALPVDRAWHVYLDPEVLETTEVPTLGFWLVHQVSHLLRGHAARAPLTGTEDRAPRLGWRTPEQCRWNAASDAEIDDDLNAGDIALPEGALTPAHLGCPDGWLAEQYWDAIDEQHHDCDITCGSTDCGGDEYGHTDCGSGCDGQARPWDCGRPGLGRLGHQLVTREVAQRVREHCRQRGDVPAGWLRWADEVLEPLVSWQRVLSSSVRRAVADVAGRVDFSYRKPSRRASAVPDVALPSLRQPLPRVAMVLDTSGSMSDAMLGQVLAEVGGVLRHLGVGRRHLQVICCDAIAYQAQGVLAARDVRLAGGGGTNMGAGLDAALALKPRPDLVIVLTDGHTPWPPPPPAGVRVVVGLMDRSGTVPDWATTVVIEPAVSW